MLIWSDFGALSAISAMVPSGPESGRSADPSTMVISPPPFEGFGSWFNAAARSWTFCELNTCSFATGASFFLKIDSIKSKKPACVFVGMAKEIRKAAVMEKSVVAKETLRLAFLFIARFV